MFEFLFGGRHKFSSIFSRKHQAVKDELINLKESLLLRPFPLKIHKIYASVLSALHIYNKVKGSHRVEYILVEYTLPSNMKKKLHDIEQLVKQNKQEYDREKVGMVLVKIDEVIEYIVYHGEENLDFLLLIEQLQSFEVLASFDFFSFLSSFDPLYPKSARNYNPNFFAINGKEVLDSIENLKDVFSRIRISGKHWNRLRLIFNSLSLSFQIDKDSWNDLPRTINYFNRYNILDFLILELRKSFRYGTESIRRKKINTTQANAILNLYVDDLTEYKEKFKRNSIFLGLQQTLEKKSDGFFEFHNFFDVYTEENSKALLWNSSVGFPFVNLVSHCRLFYEEYYKEYFAPIVVMLLLKGSWRSLAQRDRLSLLHRKIEKSIETFIHVDHKLIRDKTILQNVLRRATEVSFAPNATKENVSKAFLGNIRGQNYLVRTATVHIIADFHTIDEMLDRLRVDMNEPRDALRLLTNWADVKKTSVATGQTINRPFKEAFNNTENKLKEFLNLLYLDAKIMQYS